MMFGFGFAFPLIAVMTPVSGPAVDLVSWTYCTEALTSTTGRVTTTAVLSGPQYPNAGYGVIRFRFTHTPTAPDLVVTSNWGRVDLFADHQTITNLNGSEYLGKTYDVVEYSIKVGGVVTLDWTTIAGATLVVPAYGISPINWPA